MTLVNVFEAVYAALSAVPALGQRVWPEIMPQSNATYPAAIYQHISSTPYVTICGTNEAGDDVRIQVDIYATEFDAALSIRSAVIAAMQAITVCPVHRVSDNPAPFDDDGRLFRRSIDFVFSLSSA
jgi:Protein of unknown function (DUF3168)